MFLNNNDNSGNKKYKLLLIIIGAIVLIGIIFLIAKLFNNREIAYDDKLYYINLIGDNSVTIYLGDNYQDPGYNAMDEDGNDVTNNVVITDNVDISNIGNYKVTYTLGNVTKERIVKVIAKPVGATYIHLYGDINTYLYVGETYQEKGYEVVDTVDGSNLNSQVKVNSNVNTSKEGIYKVTYSVTNSGGVTTTQERTVIVMDRSLSLLPNITDLTNQNVTINIYAKDELFSYLILPNNNKVTERISTYEVNSNGTYKFVMYNTKGEKSEKEVEITNIDKTKPSGSCSGYYKNNTSYITVNANDNVGISKYVINNTTYTTSNITINTTLTSVNVTIYDKAGNTVIASCNLENKDGSQPSSSKSSSSKSSSSKSSSSKPSSSSSSHEYVKTDIVVVDANARYHQNGYNGLKYYLYNQCDYPWKNQYVAHSTYCQIGCDLNTCVVIISAYERYFTPKSIIGKGNTEHHDLVIEKQTNNGFDCTKYDKGKITNKQIIEELKKGNVISIKVFGKNKGGYSKFTSSQHYMALVDYYDGEIFVGNAYNMNKTYGKYGWFKADEVLTSVVSTVVCVPQR